jgi:hypothetical protein
MKIHLIVSCSDGKRAQEGQVPEARNLKRKRFDSRVREWTKMVSSGMRDKNGNQVYKGQYWSVIRSIQQDLTARGISHKTTIISAGLGIITESDKVPVYSATFSKDSPDYVFATDGVLRDSCKTTADWVQAMTVSFSGAKRLNLIKRRAKGGVTIILLSPPYLSATIPFLDKIPKEDLIIFSSKPKLFPKFEESIIPINSDLQPHLGGAQISLGGRMAKFVLNSAKDPTNLNPKKARCSLEVLNKLYGKKRTFDRSPITDEKVKTLIRKYSKQGIHQYTPMLRLLRDSGFACEMKRFKTIFEEVKRDEKRA